MNRKRTLVTTLVAALTLATVPAVGAPGQAFGPQGRGTGQLHADCFNQAQSAPRGVERMAAVLKLTDAQREQIMSIRAAAREKSAPLREELATYRAHLREATLDGDFDEERVRGLAREKAELKAELMVERSRLRNQIHALLTPEQQQMTQRLRAARSREKGLHGKRRAGW